VSGQAPVSAPPDKPQAKPIQLALIDTGSMSDVLFRHGEAASVDLSPNFSSIHCTNPVLRGFFVPFEHDVPRCCCPVRELNFGGACSA
jgi:hypothetical protein